jgi:hypothetical protein
VWFTISVLKYIEDSEQPRATAFGKVVVFLFDGYRSQYPWMNYVGICREDPPTPGQISGRFEVGRVQKTHA